MKEIDVTCALILDNQKRVLVAQRGLSMSLPLKWEFPGGKLEKNESPEECLIREIKEELDIQIEVLLPLQCCSYVYPSISINLIPFVARQVNGNITLKEHADFRWLNRIELLNLDWADADVPILHQYLNSLNAI